MVLKKPEAGDVNISGSLSKSVKYLRSKIIYRFIILIGLQLYNAIYKN